MTDHILNDLARLTHIANKRWWTDLATGELQKLNIGELLMLTVSELAEAMEGHRKGLMDDKLPQYPMFDVELVDCLIRVLDMFGALGIDVGAIYDAKMKYNASRRDHMRERRLAAGGKKY